MVGRMIDHVGFPVSDYARSKAFYEKALAPLGYTLIMEVQQQRERRQGGRASARSGKPDFWIGGEGGLEPARCTSRSPRGTARPSMRSTAPRLQRAARDNGAPGLRPHYHPNYYGAFVLDPDGHNIEAVCHARA